jgi:hypothetical protein
MGGIRGLERALARESVEIVFYRIIEKDGKRMLKPIAFKTKVSLGLVRAIADDTVIPSFYSTLSSDLRKKGLEPGTKVQLRAVFSESHAMLDPALKGTRVLCEVVV